MKFLADENFSKPLVKKIQNFLKGQLLQVPLVIFDFPRVPTQEIILKVEDFISALQKQDLSKKKVLKFSKSGLEEFQRI